MSNKYYLIAIVILVIGAAYLFTQKPTTTTPNPNIPRIVSADSLSNTNGEFVGEKGETVALENGQLSIPSSGFDTNKVRFFNTQLNGKTIYFMVVRDSQGIYRAAANGCEVCFGAHKGFRQEGDKIICNNCGNAFALDTLGVTKGGCNPGPISSNITLTNGNLIINQSDLSQVTNLF